MRKNKGYQQDRHRFYWRRRVQYNSDAKGENKTFEQYLADIDAKFDYRIEKAKREYEHIARKTTLVGEDLRKYCRDWLMWEVKFDDNHNLMPLEDVLNQLEEARERCKGKLTYEYVKRIINKDNQKFVYNSGSGADESKGIVRVPSMKRSKATWKRFYELFPYYKEHYDELNNINGLKLKKVW